MSKYEQEISSIKQETNARIGLLLKQSLAKLIVARDSLLTCRNFLTEAQLIELLDIQTDINSIMRRMEVSFSDALLAHQVSKS